jgi:hypothetical protein
VNDLIRKAVNEYLDDCDNQPTALAKCAVHLKLLQELLEQTLVNRNLVPNERDDLTMLVVAGLEKCRENILELDVQSNN